MFKLIYRNALKIPKIDSLNNYLFFGPHPDDIEISSGATIAKLVAMGKKVTFVIVTDGRVGSVDHSINEEELVKIRQKEAIESANKLGVKDVYFLPFHDGNDYDLKEMEKEIIIKILDIKPDICFFPDPTVRTEFHADHLNVGRVVANAIMECDWEKINKRFGIEGAYSCNNIAMYYTDKPNTLVRAKKYFKTKCEAIRCHKSQFTKEGFSQLELYFKLSGLRLGLKHFSSYSEGFRVLTSTHMHCFNEASIYF